MKTFTKWLVAAVMATYFFGVIYGAVFCFMEGAYLGEYLSFIGVPTATAIGFYCWKAKAENMVKFRKELPKEEQKEPPTLNEILEEIEKENLL
ncbi:MAG: hypothetical protein NC084_09060 [Bacteroides sp.]|nr:hypothetical protein [Eubacterium sp.]MCM1419705.1 hypothetical protein [Roseburia sp.]MCM1462845.1 hypothetical protein [Bacteroides sp.]